LYCSTAYPNLLDQVTAHPGPRQAGRSWRFRSDVCRMRNTNRAGVAPAGSLGFSAVAGSDGGRAVGAAIEPGRPPAHDCRNRMPGGEVDRNPTPRAHAHPRRPHALEDADCLFTNALTIVRTDYACLDRNLHDAITLRCQVVSSAKAAAPPPGTTHATALGELAPFLRPPGGRRGPAADRQRRHRFADLHDTWKRLATSPSLLLPAGSFCGSQPVTTGIPHDSA
jgi:hypothetical protein